MTDDLTKVLEQLRGVVNDFVIRGSGVTGNIRNGYVVIPGSSLITSGSGGGTPPPPEPTGACCPESGDCFITTQAVCIGGGGTYQGDNTTCTPDPCPPPILTGACCVGASCSIGTEGDCTGMGGTYHGDGTTCSPSPCGCCGSAFTTNCGFGSYLTKTYERTLTQSIDDGFGNTCVFNDHLIEVTTLDPVTCAIASQTCSGNISLVTSSGLLDYNCPYSSDCLPNFACSVHFGDSCDNFLTCPQAVCTSPRDSCNETTETTSCDCTDTGYTQSVTETITLSDRIC